LYLNRIKKGSLFNQIYNIIENRRENRTLGHIILWMMPSNKNHPKPQSEKLKGISDNHKGPAQQTIAQIIIFYIEVLEGQSLANRSDSIKI